MCELHIPEGVGLQVGQAPPTRERQGSKDITCPPPEKPQGLGERCALLLHPRNVDAVGVDPGAHANSHTVALFGQTEGTTIQLILKGVRKMSHAAPPPAPRASKRETLWRGARVRPR